MTFNSSAPASQILVVQESIGSVKTLDQTPPSFTSAGDPGQFHPFMNDYMNDHSLSQLVIYTGSLRSSCASAMINIYQHQR